jgi:GNAT superfamily N-acetyltransferase
LATSDAGTTLGTDRDRRRGAELARLAVAVEPKLPSSHQALAFVLLDAGDGRGALAAAETALRVGGALMLTGLILALAGDWDRGRLAAALADPALHVQLAVDRAGALAGYVLARRLAGELGRDEPALRLEVIGVRLDDQGRGIGDALLGALASWAAAHDVREIRTQASWRDHRMLRVETVVSRESFDLLRFLYAVGFEPSERLGFVRRVG